MSELVQNNRLFLPGPLNDTELVEPRVVIAKVHRDCNITCYPIPPEERQMLPLANGELYETTTNCYMYKHDEGLNPQKVMTMATVDAIARQLGASAHRWGSGRKGVIFHGGEPLLAPPSFYAEALPLLDKYLPEDTRLVTSIETNGTNLKPEYLEIFRRYNTGVGISLDGNAEGNKGRVFANGRPTFDRVMEAIGLINQPRYRHLFIGCLAVLNEEVDPMETYAFFKDILVPDGKPRINGKNPTLDFLLPLGGHDDSPYNDDAHRDRKPFARWLAPINARWLEHDTDVLNLRLAQGMLNKMRNIPTNLDALGGDGRSQIVVNTNGTYALTDTMLYAAGNVTSLAASVHSHDLEQAAVIATRRLGQLGALTLPAVCQEACPKETSSVCGGGNIPNRAKDGQFDQPSALCGDLGRMIADMRGLATALTHERRHDNALAAYYAALHQENTATS